MADSPSHRSTKPTDPGDHARGLPRWLTYAIAATAVAALVSSVAGWFLPSSSTSYNADETSKAKTRICVESKIVDKAVSINTHRVNPGEKDPAGALAVAGNARLALLGGGAFLHDRLDSQPATPADLAKAVRALADTLEQLGIGYLAEEPAEGQQPLRNALTTQIADVDKLCQ